jgi:hypothetical protein
MQPDDNPQDQVAVNPNDITDDVVLPDDASSSLAKDHPAGDTDIDTHEAYDAGLDSAAGLNE